MPLPSLEKLTPVFDIVIPSTEKSLKFRPFLVKEEKILLQAQQSKDDSVILDAIGQVAEQCAMSPLDVNALAGFDVEYLFLQLRAKSVGEIVDLSYRCKNEVELTAEEQKKRIARKQPRGGVYQPLGDGSAMLAECNNPVPVRVDLNSVQVTRNPAHKREIYFTDKLGMTMRYPNLEMAKRTSQKKQPKGNIGQALDTIALCVESVFDESSVYTNFTPEEMVQWLEKLTQAQFEKVQKFFETMPKLAYDAPFACAKCGYKTTIHLEGLEDFFR